jgi:hypothetical protein
MTRASLALMGVSSFLRFRVYCSPFSKPRYTPLPFYTTFLTPPLLEAALDMRAECE